MSGIVDPTLLWMVLLAVSLTGTAAALLALVGQRRQQHQLAVLILQLAAAERRAEVADRRMGRPPAEALTERLSLRPETPRPAPRPGTIRGR